MVFLPGFFCTPVMNNKKTIEQMLNEITTSKDPRVHEKEYNNFFGISTVHNMKSNFLTPQHKSPLHISASKKEPDRDQIEHVKTLLQKHFRSKSLFFLNQRKIASIEKFEEMLEVKSMTAEKTPAYFPKCLLHFGSQYTRIQNSIDSKKNFNGYLPQSAIKVLSHLFEKQLQQVTQVLPSDFPKIITRHVRPHEIEKATLYTYYSIFRAIEETFDKLSTILAYTENTREYNFVFRKYCSLGKDLFSLTKVDDLSLYVKEVVYTTLHRMFVEKNKTMKSKNDASSKYYLQLLQITPDHLALSDDFFGRTFSDLKSYQERMLINAYYFEDTE